MNLNAVDGVTWRERPVMGTLEKPVTSGNHLPPSGLLCDLLAMPERARVVTLWPTFGWMVNGGKPGDAQFGYQILVSRSLGDLSETRGELWDTGKVRSGQSLHIPYDGKRLENAGTYVWKVRTWNRLDRPSEWSDPQSFTVSAEPEAVSYYPQEIVEVPSVKVTPRDGGALFVDFGRTAFGWLEVGLNSEAPLDVVVRFGEKLCEDGSIYRPSHGHIIFAETACTLPTGGFWHRIDSPPNKLNTEGELAIRLPASLGVVLPFRYVEICGLPASARFRMMRVQYPFDEKAAAFDSSDSRLNAIWELCRYTMMATSFAGYYVDGNRERIPYEADAYINQLSHYAVDREYSLARRTHEHLLRYPTWPTEWKHHSILIAWADYMATGDARSLERSYDILKGEKLLFQYERPDGLLDTRSLRDIVDWPVGERDGYDFKPVNTVVNAFYYQALRQMSRIAGVLGKNQDGSEFQLRAERVAGRFNELLLDAQRGVYVDGDGSMHASLHANFFPLAFGLVPLTQSRSVLELIRSRGMACSVYAAQFLLEGLFKAGEADYAVQLLTSDGRRSWQNMLDQGASMTWEAWDQQYKPNLDWNHAWGAAPGNIITRYILGVQPVEPGYRKVAVRPQLGTLSRVEGVVPTIRGPIRIRAWRNRDGETQAEVEVPATVEIVHDSLPAV